MIDDARIIYWLVGPTDETPAYNVVEASKILSFEEAEKKEIVKKLLNLRCNTCKNISQDKMEQVCGTEQALKLCNYPPRHRFGALRLNVTSDFFCTPADLPSLQASCKYVLDAAHQEYKEDTENVDAASDDSEDEDVWRNRNMQNPRDHASNHQVQFLVSGKRSGINCIKVSIFPVPYLGPVTL